MTTQAAGLGATIRAWRDRLSPAATGLPAGQAGVSVDYIVRLEQGRATTPSAQVTSSLARALQLTSGERDHLFRLARLVPPADDQICHHIPPGVQRVAARLGDAAVAVFAADWQLLWWNRSWTALLGNPAQSPPGLRNFARDTFPVASGGPWLSHWPVISLQAEATKAAVASDLRRATGRFPRDRRLAGLIRELADGNEEFAGLWAAGTVNAHREDRKIVEHPAAGSVTVDCDVLTDGDTELKIVILTAAPGTEDETRLHLAGVAAGRSR